MKKINKTKQHSVTLTSTPAHHPGLWHYQEASTPQLDALNHSITIINTQSQGTEELRHVSHDLASLSQKGRWIVLISPPNIGYKSLLEKAGVRMDRILLVHAKDEVESLWAMEKALTSGTCSAVITWTKELNSRDNRRLQIIANKACATGYILDKKENISPNMTQAESLRLYSTKHPLLKNELH